MDDAYIHKCRGLQLLVTLSGSELVFLPPYYPGLNGIKECRVACKSTDKRLRRINLH